MLFLYGPLGCCVDFIRQAAGTPYEEHARSRSYSIPRVFLWFPHEGRVPHISLVSCEVWNTSNVDR